MILGFLSFIAWFFVVIMYLGWCNNQAKSNTKKDENLKVSDVIALPGWLFILTLPLTFVGFLIFLLVRIF
jgi:TRAP-type C4-dicarboxylate transport system permease small subunit